MSRPVLKETLLVISSGGSTSDNFVPGAPQGIPVNQPTVGNGGLTYNLTDSLGRVRPSPSNFNSRMGSPVGDPNNFYVMLPQPFDNVVKTEVRYFFMENGIDNVYAGSTVVNINQGNNTFFLRLGYDPYDSSAGIQFQCEIPNGYYDRDALAEVIFNLINQADPAATSDAVISRPSQTQSNPIYTFTIDSSGAVLPATLFSSCTIGSDGLLRIEAQSSSAILSDWAISFQNRNTLVKYDFTRWLFGFQATYNNVDVGTPYDYPAVPELDNTVYSVVSTYKTTLDIYNYILIQSQKLGTRVFTTSGIEAHALIPMTSSNSQTASKTGQFVYDGGNYSLDAAYFHSPRRLDMIDIRLADSNGALLDIGTNTITVAIRIIQSVA